MPALVVVTVIVLNLLWSPVFWVTVTTAAVVAEPSSSGQMPVKCTKPPSVKCTKPPPVNCTKPPPVKCTKPPPTNCTKLSTVKCTKPPPVSPCAPDSTTAARCGKTPSTVAGRQDQAYSVNVEPYTCGAKNTRKRKRRRWKKKDNPMAAEDDGTAGSAVETTNTVLPLPVFPPSDGGGGPGSSQRGGRNVFEIPVGQLDLLYTVGSATVVTTAKDATAGDGGAANSPSLDDYTAVHETARVQ